MAFGAICGGLDYLIGNRFHLGERFEEGFKLLGPLAISMAGIMCLVPALSGLLSTVIAPVCRVLHVDPGILGGILAIDMGGYQLSLSLASSPQVGRFAGIFIAATFGCTAVFTIPAGMTLLPENARGDFAAGILYGMISLPVSLLIGGLMCGLSFLETVAVSLPILILAFLLSIGMMRSPEKMVRGFSRLAVGIQKASILGLILGAVHYLTGFSILPEMMPLTEAMQVVCSIAIVMLGSLPLAALLQKLLRRLIDWFGKREGLNGPGTTGLMIGIISVTPALGMFGGMNKRSRIINAAALVCGASALAAHFGFTMAVEPDLGSPLLISKFAGMFVGICIAMVATRNLKGASEQDIASRA